MAQKGRRKKNSKKQAKKKMELTVVILLIASVLTAILIYTKSGWIGEKLSPMLGGIMGFIKYIVPIGIFVIAFSIVYDKKDYVSAKLTQYIVFLLCVAQSMTVYQVSKGALKLDTSFSEVIKASYDLGVNNIGGGAVGAMFAVPTIKLLGMVGAVVLSLGIAAITLIFIFGIQPTEIILSITENIKEKRNARRELEEEEEEEEIVKEKVLKRKKKKEKEEIKETPLEEQITINLNERKKNKDLIKGNQKELNSNEHLTAGLFKQEEEQKEDKLKEVLTLEHTLTVEDEDYEFPPITILQEGEARTVKGGKKAVAETATRLQKTLYSFGVTAKVENVSVGPAITRYELKPAEGVRVSKIANLADDIALNLAAESIRIEAPIPGKQAVGIEIPNNENEIVHLRDVLESQLFIDNKSKLTVGLGKDVSGGEVIADVAKMPHMLIAGSTGSGKSVCINTLVASIIYKAKPSEAKLVMIDPKIVELSVYNGIPHLLIPVVTDPRKAAGALAWAVQEMENRYTSFANKGVRDIKGYNEALEKSGENGKLPQIVIIIDELADLMMVAAKEVEDSICRLAQKARAAGMHLVIATQRPSVDVITGIIKANIPSRIAFAVSSQVDSRTILDMAGAEKLLGKGDMLFYPTGAAKPTRIQGAFISDKEVEGIVDFLKSNGEVSYNEDIIESIEKANSTDRELKEQEDDDDADSFLMDAIDTVVETGQASTSFIQRRFKVGYARAGRIMDQMEARGIISGYEGSKPRQVLITKERLEELKMQTSEEFNSEDIEE